MTERAANPPEIIAIASGKGGTGKTLIAACLGYALTRAGHRVLLVDADPGTDGLSLLLLGPRGIQYATSFGSENTFRGVLETFAKTGQLSFAPRRIERSGDGDHGVAYTALISGKGLYGEVAIDAASTVVPDLTRARFREALIALFGALRAQRDYDYVVVDTRGGFAFESTDVCAAADSFILVTDPDYTSFHQDRNLVAHISAAAKAMSTKTVLRAAIVNRAVDGDEKSFRLELEKEFPIRFTDTFAIPLDLDALKAYRVQQMPYTRAPGSGFAFATLDAFADILQVVTAQWPRERVEAWNALVREVSKAIEAANLRQLEARQIEKDALSAGADALRKHYRRLLLAVTLVTVIIFTLLVSSSFKGGAVVAQPAPEDASSPPATVSLVTVEPPPTRIVEVPTLEDPPPVLPSASAKVTPALSRSPRDVGGGKVPPPLKALPPPVPNEDLARAVTARGSYTELPGQQTATGRQLYRFSVWLDLAPALLEHVTSVRYTFNHPSFQISTFVATAAPKFPTSYEGWGCIASVTATLVMDSGAPQSFDFDQCAAMKNTR